jgi:glycerol-3-phosphate O-acyltransferase
VPLKLKYRKEQYPFVIPNLDDWPIVQLMNDKEGFKKSVIEFAKKRVLEAHQHRLDDEIAKTMFLERERIQNDPWRVDPPNEKVFWSKVQKDLLKQPLEDAVEKTSPISTEKILEKIIERYATEIQGHFDKDTYWFARRFLTSGFTRLLNAASAKNVWKLWGMRHRLQERIQSVGEVEHIRELAKKGTIVLVPTHFSNLDSILIGLSLDYIGMPAFSYGAGLNLFNTGILAYFMNRLGAYRIDRRKKSSIYLETLKAYSNLSIQRGVHSLFFPGGTRARSGQIEDKLKLGMLSTVIEAQQANYKRGTEEKIFVVPLMLGYHFVLEAKSLIEQHLKKTGKEQYYSKDEFRSYSKLTKFVWEFFGKSSEIVLSFGKPFDVMGNEVDENGVSYGKNGEIINTKDYFISNQVVTNDKQRDAVYTQLLGEKIVERFYAENIALSSHVIAFTAFNYIKNQHPDLDIYDLMRIPVQDIVFEKDAFYKLLTAVREDIFKLGKLEKIKISEAVQGSIEGLVKNAISNLGIYHAQKAFMEDKTTGNFKTQNIRLLYYYHNHLVGYGIEHRIKLS